MKAAQVGFKSVIGSQQPSIAFESRLPILEFSMSWPFRLTLAPAAIGEGQKYFTDTA